MTILTETRAINISLRYWNGGENPGYEPDCFSDIEVEFASSHDMADGSNDFIATDVEADDLIAWWEQECNAANSGNNSEVLSTLTDEQRERGDEWVLTVE